MERVTPIKRISENHVVNLAIDTIGIGKQALIFTGTRPGAEKSAEETAKCVNFGPGREKEIRILHKLAEDVVHSLDSPTRQCERLGKCVRKGIAFHHSGLTAKQRSLIEDNFRNGTIKIICCTPSLAVGVDLPAYRAIIRDLKRFTQHGYDWIPVLEYHQMSGRAGRPSYDNEGQAIILSSSDGNADELEERFIRGESEEIYSKLAVEPVLRTYLLSLIAARITTNRQEILSFFEKTFWAHQFKDMARLEKIINRMLLLLEQWEFIRSSENNSGFMSAKELGSGRIVATLLGNRVAELYLDPLTAFNLINGIKLSESRGISPFTLLQLTASSSELRPLLRVRMKEHDALQETLMKHETNLLTREPPPFDDEYEGFLSSVKTAAFFNDWIDEHAEDFLLEKYNVRPGEIKAKLDSADWLIYSIAELTKILQMKEQLKEILKLRLRMKYGAKEELLPLLQLKNVGRVRARRLVNGRIRTLADVKRTDPATLATILGSGKLAVDVKKQLGQEVAEVKPGKRKGQTSISKY